MEASVKTVAEESSVTAAERDAARAKLDMLEQSIADMSHPNMRMLLADLEAERIVRRVLVSALSSANHDCCNLSHQKSDQHKYDDPCPVEARIVAALALAAQLFRGN